jgi:predicted ATPase/DNA-binding SARP family transcriptional activator
VRVDVAVLGPLELRGRDGAGVPVAGARLRALLVLLALDANRVVTAERLIDGVWGDEPPAAATNALQALVSRLRKTAPELVVEGMPNGYRLVIDADCVDVHRFVRLAPRDPAAALGLWRGEPDFPDVARADAVRLTELKLTAQRRHLAEQMALRDVVPELEGLVAADPLDEQLVALLMKALADQGKTSRALEVFERTRQELAERLGTDPRAELAELHLELLRADAPVKRGNLPAEVSSFVGRDSDVRTVKELIAGHRLVTLLGPGGSGKTRLSVEVGSRLPGEVWRVELAPLTDPGEVPQAIVTALRLRGQLQFGRPAAKATTNALLEMLAGREMLLILDNCEHLIAAAADVADTLLRAAPGLRLLTTSREPLGIPGERIHAVEPLALPPVGSGASVASGFPSVRLLLDRAAGFRIGEDNVEAVVRVCRALDGMPLAIELAAARLRTLPVAVLADRLADRFRLLTGGSRTALPRHQTLRAVVDWSWDLISEGERRLWRRFAVFHGGADVTMVERVCDTDVDLLAALVDKSLLVFGADGRYRMLETIREYGLERLAEAGEAESQRLALAHYLLEIAAEAEPHLRGRDQLLWLHRLGEEHDNLHASIRAAIDAGDAATAYALVARLGWYWWLRGHRMEGAALAAEVSTLTVRAEENAPPGRAEVSTLTGKAEENAPPGRAEESTPAGKAEESTLTGAPDEEDIGLTHAFAAINGLEGAIPIDQVQSHFLAAERHGAGRDARHPALRLIKPLVGIFEQPDADAGFQAVEPLFDDPDPWLRAVSRMIVAHLRLNFGQSSEAAAADMREALAGFRAIGERWGIGFSLSALADLAAADGDFAQAVRWQYEAIALVREVGIREDIPQLEVKLAHQLWMGGELAEARRMLKQSRQSAEEIGLPEVIASVQHGYATFARMEGNLDEARTAARVAAREMDNPTFAPQFRATTRSTLGSIEAQAGDLAAAREHHAAALRMAVETRDQPVIAQVLVGVADLALREGDPERAAFLLGAADAVRGSRDLAVPDTDRIIVETRAALGDAGFTEAYGKAAQVTVATATEVSGL